MTTLYYREDCPFCWKVRIALEELAHPYDGVIVRHGEVNRDVVALNPKGTVPVLVDNDLVLWESSIIIEFLHDSVVNSHLLPKDKHARAKVRMLQHYSDSVIGPALRGLIFEKRAKDNSDWDAIVIAASDKAWRECLTYLESKLAGADAFSKEFSVADCALSARLGLADHYGAAVDKRHPILSRWYDRIRRRKAFLATEPARPWAKSVAAAI